jgi:hypothetical protein
MCLPLPFPAALSDACTVWPKLLLLVAKHAGAAFIPVKELMLIAPEAFAAPPRACLEMMRRRRRR